MTKTTFQIALDPEARAAYLKFSDSAVAETLEAGNGLHVDLDHQGHLVGIEILAPGTLPILLHRTPEFRAKFPMVPEIEPQQLEPVESFFVQ